MGESYKPDASSPFPPAEIPLLAVKNTRCSENSCLVLVDCSALHSG